MRSLLNDSRKRSGGDRRKFQYTISVEDRREKKRRCVIDRRELYVNYIRRKVD